MHYLLSHVAPLIVWLFLLTIVFVPLEHVFALHPGRGWRAQAADLGWYFLNSLLPAALLAVPLSLLGAGVRAILPDAYLAAVAALPFAARLAIGLLITEIGTYWAHRWTHRSPFLWRFHVVHHAPEQIDWMINLRAHPLDMVFTRLCGLAPLYALGLATVRGSDAATLLPIYVSLFGTVWAFFIHANVRWRFGPLEWLVATPAFHHWHHTNDAHRDHNYAALFPWVDRLFGTLHLPRTWPPGYGVDRPPAPSMRRQLLDPIGFAGGPGSGAR